MRALSFLFLNANTPWVYALADRLAQQGCPTHAVRLYDWLVYWRNRPSWPDAEPVPQLTRTRKVMPTGYAGRLEWVFRPLMQRMIRSWHRELHERSGTVPWVIAPYPYLVPWLDGVTSERIVYYNLDAYTLYRPERATSIRSNERELVRRASHTLCLSNHQVETLRQRYPEHADRIYHFPLGVVESFLNAHPQRLPESNTVGYIGNLTDRVDWSLVHDVARRLPNVQFQFVGGLDELETGGSAEGWQEIRSAALALSNVEHVGRVPQEEVKEYYWSFAVNWIPYDANHPFNKASCPTKIMDTLASGRPVVSTPVPECTLYPAWIEIADVANEAVSALTRALALVQEGRHPMEAQLKFARQHTWDRRARQLTSIINEISHA